MTPDETTTDRPTLEAGDHVIDKMRDPNDPDPGIARVIEVLDTTAEAHTIEELGETVAELNPSFPPSDTVIAIKFISTLDGRPQGLTFHYPRSRLKRYTGDVKDLRMETESNND